MWCNPKFCSFHIQTTKLEPLIQNTQPQPFSFFGYYVKLIQRTKMKSINRELFEPNHENPKHTSNIFINLEFVVTYNNSYLIMESSQCFYLICCSIVYHATSNNICSKSHASQKSPFLLCSSNLFPMLPTSSHSITKMILLPAITWTN